MCASCVFVPVVGQFGGELRCCALSGITSCGWEKQRASWQKIIFNYMGFYIAATQCGSETIDGRGFANVFCLFLVMLCSSRRCFGSTSCLRGTK